METISITASKNYVTIKIPVDLLVHSAENSEAFEGIKVTNKRMFAEEVAQQLDGAFYDPETGLTKFQMLLDEVYEEVVESGSDAVSIEGDE